MNAISYNILLQFLSSITDPPDVSTMDYQLTDSSHTLSCVSSGSPPTHVIWERDGEKIYFNDSSYDSYHSNQVLLDRVTSTYNNTLTINATIEDVVGEYSCTVVNSIGSSETITRAVRGDS